MADRTTRTARAADASRGASHYAARPQLAFAAGARGDASRKDSDAQSNASSTDHIKEKAAGPPLTKRQKIRLHCGRFWLWYLIATVVFLIIFLPVFFKVIIPSIIQSIINKQNLPLDEASLDCISATRVRLALNTSLDTPLPAKMSEFSLSLYNKDTSPFTPFANLTIPEQKVNGYTKLVVPSQEVTIANETELVGWFSQIFDAKQVDVSVNGHPTIHLGALEAHPTIDKTISVPGLNRLAGISITDLKLMLPPDGKGNNIKGTVIIPNVSILRLNLGNITFDLFSGKVKLGQITTYNVLLNIGNNTLNYDGKLDLPNVMKNVGSVMESQKEPLTHGQVGLNITATTVMVQGQRIPYIEKVLGRSPLSASIPVISLMSNVLGGFLGGGGGGSGASIFNVLGDVVGNNTFLQNVINNYNHTQTTKKDALHTTLIPKRVQDPKDALLWKMMQLGLRMKLGQAGK